MKFRRSNLLRWAIAGAVLTPFAAGSLASAPPVHAAKNKKANLEIKLDVQDFKLDNGLRIYVVEDHSTPAFNINITYDVGSRDEVPGKTGFAHFFEHMMFQGSKNIPRNKIAEYTENAGGNVNAATSFDMTFYYHNIPSQYLEMVLWGEADRLENLEITQEAFDVQREAVKSEKNMRVDNQPFAKAQKELIGTLFEGTPYSHMPIGSLEDLDAAKAADTETFFETYYRPNNAVMVIVGDVDFATVKDRVTHYFAGIAAGEPKPPAPESKQVRGRKVEKVFKDDKAQQTQWLVAWPTVGMEHEDRAALEILASILFTGESARVPKVLTDEKKWTTVSFGSALTLREAGGVFMIMVPTAEGEKNMADVKKFLADELAKIAKKGVDKKELEKATNQQVMGTVSTLASNAGRASSIATGALFYDDPKRVISDLDRYRAVTTKDVKRVAGEYLNDNWIFFEMKPAG